MKLPALTTDNITEMLIKIIEFTQIRQKILTQNIKNMDQAGFVPKDLAIGEFCGALNGAISEHIMNRRLIWCDTKNVKFGIQGGFELSPITDKNANELLKKNQDRYIGLQTDKLLENSFNQRLAAQLLRLKQKKIPICE